ncbi:hypothetical protein KQI52_10720 [bacterium]|nr:hypothetical protein [bacterium]
MLTVLLSTALLFPTVIGKNLHGDRFTLPEGFTGSINIVLVAFQREQQPEVDTWLPLVKELEAETPELVRYWELPTISSGYKWMSFIIDNGMRSGIPDSTARERTITLYIDRSPMLEALEIPNTEEIEVYVLDANGYVRWRDRGPRTDTGAAGLRSAVGELIRGDRE